MTAFNLFKKSKKPVSRREVADKRTEVSESSVQLPKTIGSAQPVILHSYVSEKASVLQGLNQYVFKVSRNANKPEVKKAIQKMFNVSVVAVRMQNMPSKKRTLGRRVGIRSGFRKAIVTLAKGDSINSA